mmetsp:Transcript_36827/g.77604  ORF Transcript_36827/g.77604 Transcript_36827/m.77604 type:complete len:92 (-) Transcript_36827:66-341(-)
MIHLEESSLCQTAAIIRVKALFNLLEFVLRKDLTAIAHLCKALQLIYGQSTIPIQIKAVENLQQYALKLGAYPLLLQKFGALLTAACTAFY